jgi:hypothetical protein
VARTGSDVCMWSPYDFWMILQDVSGASLELLASSTAIDDGQHAKSPSGGGLGRIASCR